MENIIYILRGVYISLILFNILVVIKKIFSKIHKKNNLIFYSNWIFCLTLFIVSIFNFIFIMTDLIKNSWQGLEFNSFLFLIALNIINVIFSILLYISTKNHLEINDDFFILYKLFSRQKIEFKNIDKINSKYVFVITKNNKFFLKRNIFSSKEYFQIKLNNNEIFKINLNPLMYQGNFTFLMTIIIKLKIKRIKI